MSYVYKNITNRPHLIAVMNESRTDVSHIPLAPGARIEVSEPTLDNYMPHILARLNDAGTDITHMILRQKELQKKADEEAALKAVKPAPKVADVTTFSDATTTTTSVIAPKVEVVPAPKAIEKAPKISKKV